MNLEERFIETNGIRLHLIEAGPKSGSPVIFLHGFPDFWYGWKKQLPAFVEAGHRVILPDQRGYNLSDKPRGVKAYHTSELVKDMVGLINALGYEKVNLVGHDFGGIVAWLLAILEPERVHRLGILNIPHPAVIKRFLLRDLEQLRRSWYAFAFQIPRLPEAFMRAHDWRNGVRILRGSGKLHTFRKDDLTEYKKAWSQAGAMTAMLNWYRAAFRDRLRVPANPRVRVPTLMIWGMKDIALTHRMARPSMDYCDDGKLLFFPEATHWVQRDEADEINRLLIAFFK